MAVRILDLRQQPEKCTFTNTSKEEIRYGEAFWQSVRLQPTMESRLVSSDIKQRLGKRNASSKSGASTNQGANELDRAMNEFYVRARTLDQIERFQRLNKLAEARNLDRDRLHKRREERIKKELISRDRVMKPISCEEMLHHEAMAKRKIGEAYSIEAMLKEMDEFELKMSKRHHERKKSLKPPGVSTTLKKKVDNEPEVIVLVSSLEN